MAEKNMPMREALRAALREEMLRDETVFVMGEEVGAWQGTHRVTRGFLEEFLFHCSGYGQKSNL